MINDNKMSRAITRADRKRRAMRLTVACWQLPAWCSSFAAAASAAVKRNCRRAVRLGIPWLVIAGSVVLPACGQVAPRQPAVVAPQTREASGQNEVAQPRTIFRRPQQLENGEDWAAFLGPRGDGTSKETGIDPANWEPHPPLNWILQLGVGYAGPTLVDGQLLQFDRFGEVERLTCFDAQTLEERWRQEAKVRYDDMFGYNNGPRCSPVVDGERIYTYGVAGRLTCVRLDDGEVLWTKDTLDEYDVVPNFFGVASSPIIYEDKLLVMIGGSPESQNVPNGRLDLVEPNGTAVVAFDKFSGEELYRVGDDLASYASLAIRPIAGQSTGLAFLRNGLLAWEPQTGEELFRFPWRANMLESVNAAVPVTSENRILLSEAYEVGSVLLEVDDGSPQVVWQDEGPRNQLNFRAHWSTPVVIGDYLYGCNGRNQPDSDLRCIRLSDGSVQWRNRRHQRSSLIAIDGYLIVLGEYGRLELIKPNPERLEVIAEVDLNSMMIGDFQRKEELQPAATEPVGGSPVLSYPCWAAPVVSHGLLYVRGKDHLVCLQLIEPDETH